MNAAPEGAHPGESITRSILENTDLPRRAAKKPGGEGALISAIFIVPV